MKSGYIVISPKDGHPEQLMEKNGEFYGNRTDFNYGTMEENKEEEKKEVENNSVEDFKEVNKKMDEFEERLSVLENKSDEDVE